MAALDTGTDGNLTTAARHGWGITSRGGAAKSGGVIGAGRIGAGRIGLSWARRDLMLQCSDV